MMAQDHSNYFVGDLNDIDIQVVSILMECILQSGYWTYEVLIMLIFSFRGLGIFPTKWLLLTSNEMIDVLKMLLESLPLK